MSTLLNGRSVTAATICTFFLANSAIAKTIFVNGAASGAGNGQILLPRDSSRFSQALAMRQILIDHARRRGRAKRGGDACRVTLDEAVTPVVDFDPELLDLDEALQRLAELDERQGRLVELRFFGGLTVEEVAHVLGVSKTTVETEWRIAKA